MWIFKLVGVSGDLAFVVQHALVVVAGGQVVGLFQILGKGAFVNALVQCFVDILQQVGIALGHADDITFGFVGNFAEMVSSG